MDIEKRHRRYDEKRNWRRAIEPDERVDREREEHVRALRELHVNNPLCKKWGGGRE